MIAVRHCSHQTGRTWGRWLALAVIAAPAAGAWGAPPDTAGAPGAPPSTNPAGVVPPADVPSARDVPAAPLPPPAAGSPAARRALADKVLILPFQPVGGRGGDTWIGRSIQQSLLADLTMAGPLPVGSAAAAVADTGAATEAATKAGSRYVVYGLVHINDHSAGTSVRATGQVLDATTGRVLGAVKATGSLDDLFPMEDELADQARRVLAQVGQGAAVPRFERTPPSAGRTTEPYPTINPSGPVRIGSYDPAPWYYDEPVGSAPPPAALYRHHYGTPAYFYSGYQTRWPAYGFRPYYPRYYYGGYGRLGYYHHGSTGHAQSHAPRPRYIGVFPFQRNNVGPGPVRGGVFYGAGGTRVQTPAGKAR